MLPRRTLVPSPATLVSPQWEGDVKYQSSGSLERHLQSELAILAQMKKNDLI